MKEKETEKSNEFCVKSHKLTGNGVSVCTVLSATTKRTLSTKRKKNREYGRQIRIVCEPLESYELRG